MSAESTAQPEASYGCSHYKRRCELEAPCCRVFYVCRLCHDEATQEAHLLDRHSVKHVRCCACGCTQEVAQTCRECGVVFGQYFCAVCNFFDDQVERKYFHCDGCGICRVGGRENFFHCDKCGCCLAIASREGHKCLERTLDQNCFMCMEHLFSSRRPAVFMRCGHPVHQDCFDTYVRSRSINQLQCPLCNKELFTQAQIRDMVGSKVRLLLRLVDALQWVGGVTGLGPWGAAYVLGLVTDWALLGMFGVGWGYGLVLLLQLGLFPLHVGPGLAAVYYQYPPSARILSALMVVPLITDRRLHLG